MKVVQQLLIKNEKLSGLSTVAVKDTLKAELGVMRYQNSALHNYYH